MITVDSRRRDPKSEEAVKYVSLQGRPIQYKPVRKITPDLSRLSKEAAFIAENAEGKYLGGMLLNGFLVRVEGPIGSQFNIEVKNLGQEKADEKAKLWGWNKSNRSVIQGWQFPIFEPEDDPTQYLNNQATKIVEAAGKGGRIILNNKTLDIL